MSDTPHVPMVELEAGLEAIRQSPADAGALMMIVRRPDSGAREVLAEGELDLADGLSGDNWRARGSSRTADGAAHPDMQLTLINARLLALIAGGEDRWPLAGDQLVVDLDLGAENLPPGTRLSIGAAVVAVTAQPHTGCAKFLARFGRDALAFISAPEGKRLNLRGINAKVIRPGRIRVGDMVRKLDEL
ncbi:hypothetical protein K2Z83_10740 [Oscillochloris sp. ZM17-4]|uniref:MOSC domain-containing protein n=1 Tax=Oscillochloris sp. ZM17-4 TaxID=2866714 RepID=UPI001C73C449|nr:hypothetical protein [Oscillochloris sp. ZM17-4]MBX0328155.1 hypothetical protein [Oscillochloris sp. ZM17-4]